MSAELSNALPLILLGLFLLVVGIWVISRSLRKAKVVEDGSAAPLARDVLDEGAERAQRNQALIDAAPAAVAKADTVSAAANTQAVAAAPLGTDAEAGPGITPTVVAPAPAPEPAETPATEMGAEIAPELADSPAAATVAPDDLARIKGIGPKLVALLGELGITTYVQIASWEAADIERIDAQLGRFAGRITRDQWVEQAKLLCAGDEAAFTDKFGRNG